MEADGNDRSNQPLKKQHRVGYPFSRLPSHQTVRALLRHTAYQYVTIVISV